MKEKIFQLILILIISPSLFSQSIDNEFSVKKMKLDLEVFKAIRLDANSGLYKYRTKNEMDSVYRWADREVEKSSTILDFYNIIHQITDFEGSVHNDTSLPEKYYEALREEKSGYIPLQIKFVEGKALMNVSGHDIPLGAEIISVNGEIMEDICKNFFKYYTTDGYNITGKFIGINDHFSKYYRLHYGMQDKFEVKYKKHGEYKESSINLDPVSYSESAKLFDVRHSEPMDKLDYIYYTELEEKFSYRKKNSDTGILTINTFVMGGNEADEEHKEYVAYLDSIFIQMKQDKVVNLIVDVRHNGGGTDPNDLATYAYLAQKEFVENTQGWISFGKIPHKRYLDTWVPRFLRFAGVLKYNLYFQQEFPISKDGGHYQDNTSSDHKSWKPNANAFDGQLYLLISPRIASAGSLFAALVARNDNVTIIGEETMGGYYGHNGHVPMSYKLPNSKMKITFSIVNLTQDVEVKSSQKKGRGIMPNHRVVQSYDDFMQNVDAPMKYVMEMIDED